MGENLSTRAELLVVCYTAVFSVVTQRSFLSITQALLSVDKLVPRTKAKALGTRLDARPTRTDLKMTQVQAQNVLLMPQARRTRAFY